jgi:hypothetical protein
VLVSEGLVFGTVACPHPCDPQKVSALNERAKVRPDLKDETKIRNHRSMMRSCLLWLNLVADLLHFVVLNVRSRNALAAENLFLRKQLAFYQERRIGPAGPPIQHV